MDTRVALGVEALGVQVRAGFRGTWPKLVQDPIVIPTISPLFHHPKMKRFGAERSSADYNPHVLLRFVGPHMVPHTTRTYILTRFNLERYLINNRAIPLLCRHLPFLIVTVAILYEVSIPLTRKTRFHQGRP